MAQEDLEDLGNLGVRGEVFRGRRGEEAKGKKRGKREGKKIGKEIGLKERKGIGLREDRKQKFNGRKAKDIGLKKCIYHTLHPVQGGRGLQFVREHLTPSSHQEGRDARGTLGVQVHLTQKQSLF